MGEGETSGGWMIKKQNRCAPLFPAKGLVIGVIAILLLSLAPYYLSYSTLPQSSDVIIIFVGPDQEIKTKEAHELIEKNLARYLYIPAYSKLMLVDETQALEEIEIKGLPTEDLSDGEIDRKLQSRKLENTHREVLLAKDMMYRLGIRSAIFVSLPYHMRRIKHIAEEELNETDFDTFFVSAAAPLKNQYLWWLDKDSRWWVSREYVKILWFHLYNPFT